MAVEGHPIDYADFEGSIAEAEYGGGTVIVWDRGTYVSVSHMTVFLGGGGGMSVTHSLPLSPAAVSPHRFSWNFHRGSPHGRVCPEFRWRLRCSPGKLFYPCTTEGAIGWRGRT